MDSPFMQAAYKKYTLGSIKHGRPWRRESVDAYAEAQQECLDLYWYASLFEDELLKQKVQETAESLWNEFEQKRLGEEQREMFGADPLLN